ncbi:MAG: response regulator [Micavibrio sp.]|nr:MAG: response regulator [Micavibrio sp.]
MSESKGGGAGRILVVDDEPDIREFVRRSLGHEGYEVAVAEDGYAALRQLDGGVFDLLLTDIVMPDLDGISLALKAARDFPKMKIIMMTGYAGERGRAHNLDALVADILGKPFTREELRRCVTGAMQKKLV